MKDRHNRQIAVQGLHKLKDDARDFSLAGFFNQIKIEDVPTTDFVVASPIRIKDQGNTDFCSAYAVTSVSEDQEGVELLPEYQFFKTKQIMGNPDEWGADLRSACKSAVKFGSLEESARKDIGDDFSRETVISPSMWPSKCDEMAKNHRKQTYFTVDGRYDLFDNIRTALWQNSKEKRSIVVGAEWKQEWTDAEGGIIPKAVFDGGFGHAFKIFGQKNIAGEIYLIAQLSNSEHIGDKGLFYFPREVVNRDMSPFGAFMFQDVARETVEGTVTITKFPLYTWLIDRIISFFK